MTLLTAIPSYQSHTTRAKVLTSFCEGHQKKCRLEDDISFGMNMDSNRCAEQSEAHKVTFAERAIASFARGFTPLGRTKKEIICKDDLFFDKNTAQASNSESLAQAANFGYPLPETRTNKEVP